MTKVVNLSSHIETTLREYGLTVQQAWLLSSSISLRVAAYESLATPTGYSYTSLDASELPECWRLSTIITTVVQDSGHPQFAAYTDACKFGYVDAISPIARNTVFSVHGREYHPDKKK